MTDRFSTLLKWKRVTIGALALSCTAIVYAVAASGCCNEGDIIIHDECYDAGVPDGGDAASNSGGDPDYCADDNY